MVKLDINALNFSHSGSNSIKVTFLDSSRQNLSNSIYIYLLGFREVRISHCFFIVFSNDIIMTLFPATWFSNLHILWNFE